MVNIGPVTSEIMRAKIEIFETPGPKNSEKIGISNQIDQQILDQSSLKFQCWQSCVWGTLC